MSYKETINNISGYMNSEIARKELYGHAWNIVDLAIKNMISTINEALDSNDSEQVIAQQEVNNVFRGTNVLIDTIVSKKFSYEFKEFAKSYTALLYNWNKIAKVDDAARKISIVNTLVDYHSSTVASIDLLKELLRRFQDLKNFNPPVFKLSEHYLKSLSTKLNK